MEPGRFNSRPGRDKERMMQSMDKQTPLSDQATEKVQRPHYWSNVREFIISETGLEFETAFLEVQKDLDAILKTDSTGAHNSVYASLANILNYIRPVANKNGFTIKQFTGSIRSHGDGNGRWQTIPILTKITHAGSMQSETVVFDLPVDRSVNSFAGASTTGRRYALLSYFGVAPADDQALDRIQKIVSGKAAETAASAYRKSLDEVTDEKGLSKWFEEYEDAIEGLEDEVAAVVRHAYKEKLRSIKTPKKVAV